MEDDMNIFEKIHYVQQHASAGGKASDGDLAAIMAGLMPHLGAMKLVVMFSDDLEDCSGTAFVRSTATAINVEAPYDRTACTGYEPQRTASDGVCPDATGAARRKAVEGLFALGSRPAPEAGTAVRAAKTAGKKTVRDEAEKTVRDEAEKTDAPSDSAATKPRVERAASDADLGRALAMQVKISTGHGAKLMAVGDMSKKQLEIADQRYGWIDDIHHAIEIVREFRGF